MDTWHDFSQIDTSEKRFQAWLVLNPGGTFEEYQEEVEAAWRVMMHDAKEAYR